MGLGEWIARTFYGADELQAESDQLDARRQEMNRIAASKYGDEWYQQTVANDAKSVVDAAGDIGSEFKADALKRNLVESTDTAAGWFRALLDAPLSFLFKSIPPLGWLVLVVVVFVWLGGPAWLRAQVARRSG